MRILEHEVFPSKLVGERIKLKGIKEAKGKIATVYDGISEFFPQYEIIFRKDENTLFRIILDEMPSRGISSVKLIRSLFSKYSLKGNFKVEEYTTKSSDYPQDFQDKNTFLKVRKL